MTYFIITVTIIAILLVICSGQLLLMWMFEWPYWPERKARMIIYAMVIFTLCWRLWLYANGEALVTPMGLGIGTTATFAMIVLEYLRMREVNR